jgi:hypothetical protein
MLPHEAGEVWRDDVPTHVNPEPDAKRAAQALGPPGERRLQESDFVEDVLFSPVELLAVLRQSEPARRAVEEGHAELRLQFDHGPAHGRLRPLERAAFINQWQEKKLEGLVQGVDSSFGNAGTRIERTMFAPIFQLAQLNGVGPRLEDPAIGGIPDRS